MLNTQKSPIANIFSLHPSHLCRLFWSIEKASRKSFSSACKYFREIQKYSDSLQKIHAFMVQHYQVLAQSSFCRELTIFDMPRIRAVVLSELHCSDLDRRTNSALVDLFWNPAITEVFLESEDDSQIPGARIDAREQAKCWDISQTEKDKLWTPNLYLDQTYCVICVAYLENFTSDAMNFIEFLKQYCFIKSQLMDALQNIKLSPELFAFFGAQKVFEICEKAAVSNDLNMKRKFLRELVYYLIKEANAMRDYISDVVYKEDKRRNKLLIFNLQQSVNANKFPVVVAGDAHVKSKEIQKIAKNWNVLTLQRQYQTQNIIISDNRNNAQILDRIASELPQSPLERLQHLPRILAGLQNTSDEQCRQFVSENKEVFAALRSVMKTYEYDAKWLPLWADVPCCIYLADLVEQYND